MKPLSAFVLELSVYLGLCGVISVLLGVPTLWTVIGLFILIDLGVIIFLGQSRGPTDRGRPHSYAVWTSPSGAY